MTRTIFVKGNLVDTVASVTVPDRLNGKAITVLHRSTNVSILDAVVTGGAISICGKGGVSLKIS